jgi:hypothetical protein
MHHTCQIAREMKPRERECVMNMTISLRAKDAELILVEEEPRQRIFCPLQFIPFCIHNPSNSCILKMEEGGEDTNEPLASVMRKVRLFFCNISSIFILWSNLKAL